jgi:hypothetical protein
MRESSQIKCVVICLETSKIDKYLHSCVWQLKLYYIHTCGLLSVFPCPYIACCFRLVAQSAATCSRWVSARGFFYPEDGGYRFLRNCGYRKNYTAPHPRRRHSFYYIKFTVRQIWTTIGCIFIWEISSPTDSVRNLSNQIRYMALEDRPKITSDILLWHTSSRTRP